MSTKLHILKNLWAKIFLISFLLVGYNTATNSKSVNSKKSYPFKDTNLTLEVRVDDLISRLTLKEKIAQMFDKSPAIPRLGIAEYKWWNEALHGVARAGNATVFPQAIGLAATFNEELIYDVATAISDEGRAKHHAFLADNNRAMYTGLTFWSPNINIFRDPRWGRGQETYGEDPFLTSRIATNFVNGLQGTDSKYLKSVATIKHFAVHSGPEYSRHSDDYQVSAKDMTETYLPAFSDTIKNTNVSSIMCAYNRVNGEPACGSETLLKHHLRNEFQFNGYVVSDCGAVADIYDKKSHNVVNSPAEAAAKAVLAGTDLNCGDHHGNTFSALNEAVSLGLINEKAINQSVKRLFLARFKLGMFDNHNDVPFSAIAIDEVGSPKHLALSQKVAEASLVLLKNDGILPLSKKVNVALIGPNANNKAVLLGNYHGKPIKPITLKMAIEKMIGKENVQYAVGTSLTGTVYTHHQPIDEESFYHVDYNGKLQSGLRAEYYNKAHFGVQPVIKRIDRNINFNFTHSPIDGKNDQEFAIKWAGVLKPKQSGNFEFKTKGVEFTLNGQRIKTSIKLEANKEYAFEAQSIIKYYWHSNIISPEINLSWLNLEENLSDKAIKVAEESDVIVFVGGISANLEGEEMPLEIDGFSHGDRTHINLPNSQQALLTKLAKIGKPLVYVNMSGSAIALNWVDENSSAVIQGFYPGEATGTALTRLLFGEFSPSGRLPITFYRSIDDLPDFKDYSMDNRTYKYYQGEVLYPFGFGLSYADITYKQAELSITNTDQLSISVNIYNQSDIDTNEVVQVYLSMPDSPVKTPIRQLVSFKQINLAAKSVKKLEVLIEKEKLNYVDLNGKIQPYLGKLNVSIGSGQGIKFGDDKVLKSSIYIK